MTVNVAVRDGYDLDRVSEQLAQAGIKVGNKLRMLNMVTAEVPDSAKLEEVRSIEGVHSAEPDQQNYAL
jgi:hypothetical protein